MILALCCKEVLPYRQVPKSKIIFALMAFESDCCALSTDSNLIIFADSCPDSRLRLLVHHMLQAKFWDPCRGHVSKVGLQNKDVKRFVSRGRMKMIELHVERTFSKLWEGGDLEEGHGTTEDVWILEDIAIARWLMFDRVTASRGMVGRESPLRSFAAWPDPKKG